MITLTLPYPVSANRYWRSFSQKNRAIVVLSPDAKEYKQKVSLLASLANVKPIVGRVSLVIRLYPKRPKDAEVRIRKLGAGWDSGVQCLDLDNALKVLIDALKAIAYIDDDQVYHIDATRMEPDGDGRVEVDIAEIAIPVRATKSNPMPFGAASCQGKHPYATAELAIAVANRKGRGYGYSHYRCEVCGNWHLGHHTGKARAERIQTKQKKAQEDNS